MHSGTGSESAHGGHNARIGLICILVLVWMIVLSPFALAESRVYGGLIGMRGTANEELATIDYFGIGGQMIWQATQLFGIDVEGNYGNYFIEDYRTTSYGVSMALRINVIPVDPGQIVFSIGGGGLHFSNGGFLPWIGDSDLLAKFRTGLSLFMPMGPRNYWSVGYRFEHVSDPYTRQDLGLNYHSVVVGIYYDLF